MEHSFVWKKKMGCLETFLINSFKPLCFKASGWFTNDCIFRASSRDNKSGPNEIRWGLLIRVGLVTWGLFLDIVMEDVGTDESMKPLPLIRRPKTIFWSIKRKCNWWFFQWIVFEIQNKNNTRKICTSLKSVTYWNMFWF